MSEAESFLQSFHRDHPGATARAFAHGRLTDGRNSYAWLADLVEPGQAVLDVACGDGLLSAMIADRGAVPTGVDMSPDDVTLARERVPGVRFEVARAQSLPLNDGAFDAALSHMALMLMEEVDVVIAELARVLKPGGLLSAVVGAGLRSQDGWGLFVDLWRDVWRAEQGESLVIGDPRARSEAGWRDLLADWDGFVHEERTLDLSGDPDSVWTALSLSYNAAMVSPEGLEEIRRRWMDAVAVEDGRVTCGLILRRIEARRS